jgi:hypothetical protein
VYIRLYLPNVIFALIILKERKHVANVLEKDGREQQFLLCVPRVEELEKNNIRSKRNKMLIDIISINERN